MLSFQVEQIFDNNSFDLLKDFIMSETSLEGSMNYEEYLGRYYRMVVLPDDLKEIVSSKIKKHLSDDSLDIACFQIAKYQIKNGSIPTLEEHLDHDIGTCVVSIPIKHTIDWPLIIEDQAMVSSENSAVFIMGKEEKHKRDTFPSTSELDFVMVLLVHMSPKDGPMMQASKQVHAFDKDDAETFLNLMLRPKLYREVK